MTAVVATLPGTRTRSARVRAGVLRRLGLLAFVLGLCYLLVVPLIQLQRRALADGAAGYRTAFSTPGIGGIVGTTVLLAAGATAVALVLGTGLAIVASMLPSRLRFLQAIPVMTILLPPVATTIGWLLLLSPRTGFVNRQLRRLPWWSDRLDGPIDVNSITWIVIISGLGLSAFVYSFVSAGLRNISSDLVEAARACGSSGPAAYVRVVLPILRPVFAYAVGVVFLLGLGQFTTPLLLGRQHGVDVLSTEMYRHIVSSPSDYSAAAAAGSPLLIFGLAMVIFQRRVVGDQGRFVAQSGKAFAVRPRRAWWAPVVLVAFAVLGIALPFFSLINAALSPYWSGKVEPAKYTLSGVRVALGDPRLTDAVVTSVTVSLAAVAISLPIGFLASWMLVRGQRHPVLRTAVDLIVNIPLIVPATVLGAGFLMTYTQQPLVLYGSPWLIVLVYVALMVPFTTRMQMAGMVALGRTYDEAARACGAGLGRTLRTVTVPLMRPAIGGAAGLMFVLLCHEFSASILVRTPRTQVMGTILFDYYANGLYSWVATMALLMAGVTLVGLLVAVLLGGRRVLDRL